MQFLYPALTVGFFLALLPLLIHLINMMRHRRVKWAAMEFLLQSYKKHRTLGLAQTVTAVAGPNGRRGSDRRHAGAAGHATPL